MDAMAKARFADVYSGARKNKTKRKKENTTMKNTKGKRFLALALLAVSLIAIAVPALAITPFDYGDTCYVRAGLTNVRVNHSTSANRIYYANKGDAVVVYDIWEPTSGLAWYFVANLTQPGQRNGWIRSDCVQAARP